MKIEEAIKNRHATRIFLPDKPVQKAALEEIVSLAQKTPSWVDSQPWHVYAATGQTLAALKKKHLANVQAGKKSNPDWATMHRQDWAAFPRENMARQSKESGKMWQAADRDHDEVETALFDAPLICYLTIPKKTPLWSVYDLGAFAQTLMLAATGKGLASVAAYELVRFPDDVRAILGISSDEILGIGIALGYEDKDSSVNAFRSHRVDLNSVLTFKD
jgi:nitroreductase